MSLLTKWFGKPEPVQAEVELEVVVTRPETTAEVLRWVARHLDLTDPIVHQIARAQGFDASPSEKSSDQVQADLRLLASWLDAHPDVDADMFAFTAAALTKVQPDVETAELP